MMKPQLPNFKNASILVIGDTMLDRYWFGDALRISPEAPVPIIKIKQNDDRPGGAGNVALNIAALGIEITLIGVTGHDDAAKILTEQLIAASVIPKIQYLPNIPTITKLRVISRHQQLIRLDFEEKFPEFNPTELLQSFDEALDHVKLVILSDYNKGTIVDPQPFIKMARAKKIPILVDPKGTDFSIYRGANVLTPNLKEFEEVVGACAKESDILKKGLALIQQLDIDNLLLTRGEHGMTLITASGEEHHLPAHAREVFDVTGAGDTVIAVLGAAMACGEPIEKSMALANLAAALVVSKLGAATVSTPELQAALTGAAQTSGGVINEEQLHLAVSEAKLKNKKIVFTNGCFDILHAGHVTYLQQAKQLGDYLIVAVNDDESIQRLKGDKRPINNVVQRMAVLASLGVVDWVVPFSDATPERLLKLLQPQILVKGGDYTVNQVAGAETVRAYGGEIRVLGLSKDISTSIIIDRMVKSVSTPSSNLTNNNYESS